MCRFLTFATQSVPQLSCKDGLVESFENKGSGHVYPDGWKVLCLTCGGCSCDLVVTRSESQDPQKHVASLRQKYKKKGWSDSKIERALQDAMRSSSNLGGFSPGIAQYFTELATKAREIQFVIHHHSHGFATEPFEIKDTVKINGLLGSEPFVPREDVRYVLSLREQG